MNEHGGLMPTPSTPNHPDVQDSVAGIGHNAPPADPDALMPPQQAADFLGVSLRFLEKKRHQGDGPEYVRLSHKLVRYRRGSLIDYARARTFSSTSEESVQT